MSARRRARLALTLAWLVIVLAVAVLAAAVPATCTVAAAGVHSLALLGAFASLTALLVGIAVAAWSITTHTHRSNS
ncbi:cytochrome b subunit of formate dehydrogenase [Aeromicrobium sp. SORGH_AS981]|uniref:hypothetical protein n=1 Tax=Aeromicrobium sp. SORGH_AS_0981 TaxID=3041802 RepID=UPI002865C123|nr:hypothetical protein [Aeromicrobium sp. SORGH_AS_0981]MDR6117235.1 cytochrome b subunit of formate dehydrogenase [Aeromicrobium sp. SORGH_AS_0981]